MRARAVWLILRKDILIELRTREVLATMGLFALLLVVVFAFAFSMDKTRAQLVGPGIIWVTILFSGTLGLYRLFDRERDHAAMAGLLLAPGGAISVYIAKVLGLVLFITVTEIVVLPLMLAFMDISIPDYFYDEDLRAIAPSDIDGDGLVDMVIYGDNVDGQSPVKVLMNDGPAGNYLKVVTGSGAGSGSSSGSGSGSCAIIGSGSGSGSS